MKLIALILSVYLLFLAFVPCCIIDNCQDDKTEQTAATHNSQNEDCEGCTPFFNCEGCASPTIVYSSEFNFSLINSPLIHSQLKGEYTLLKNHFEFWQPPRAG